MLPIIAAVLVALAGPASAQEPGQEGYGRDRAVRIIEGPGKPAPAPPATGAPVAIPESVDSAADNPSGLAVEVLPGPEIPLGAKMAIRVSSKRQGYVVLVDVDAAGKLTQIYPNTLSLADPKLNDSVNLLRAGGSRTIPEPGVAGAFEFVASPPAGVGMVVAILSDSPVQVIDLPDIPAVLAGQRGAAEYVRETTRTLSILPADDQSSIVEPKWSFATRFYAIR